MTRHRLRFATLSLLLTLCLPQTGLGQDVVAGMDFFMTLPGTEQNFLTTPIPSDFFDPGSDPFTGPVNLIGVPLLDHPLCLDDDLTQADTIVRRLEDADLPPSGPGGNDTVEIEIVALNLTSVEPIVVTYNGGQDPESWIVDMDLSPSPQPPGLMYIDRFDEIGGAWAFELFVLPRFTFTRIGDGAVRVLDSGAEDIPPDYFTQEGNSEWTYRIPPAGSCTSNICLDNGHSIYMAAYDSYESWELMALCPAEGTAVSPIHWSTLKTVY